MKVPKFGAMLDCKIASEDQVIFLVAEVVGIRSDWGNPDDVHIRFALVDAWFNLADVEWDYADQPERCCFDCEVN